MSLFEQSYISGSFVLAFKILSHALFSIFHLLLHTTSKLSAVNLASFFVEKIETGTSSFVPVPIYKPEFSFFQKPVPNVCCGSQRLQPSQGLCSLSYPLSLPSYQPRPLSGIITNSIQTCSGVGHSNKPSLLLSSSLQLLYISLFAFTAKHLYLLTSFYRTLQCGFCPTVHQTALIKCQRLFLETSTWPNPVHNFFFYLHLTLPQSCNGQVHYFFLEMTNSLSFFLGDHTLMIFLLSLAHLLMVPHLPTSKCWGSLNFNPGPNTSLFQVISPVQNSSLSYWYCFPNFYLTFPFKYFTGISNLTCIRLNSMIFILSNLCGFLS